MLLESFAKRKFMIGCSMLGVILLTTLISACASVIGNSEHFYKDMPRRPTNWREYLSD